MTLYELRQSELKPIANTTFAEEQFSERGDLQRLLRDQPEVLEQASSSSPRSSATGPTPDDASTSSVSTQNRGSLWSS